MKHCPQRVLLMPMQTLGLMQNHLFDAYILWHQNNLMPTSHT